MQLLNEKLEVCLPNKSFSWYSKWTCDCIFTGFSTINFQVFFSKV